MGRNWDNNAELAIKVQGPSGVLRRDEVCKYVATIAAKDYPVGHVVSLLHEHAALGDDEKAHGDQAHREECATMTMTVRRTLTALGGAAHAAGGWTPEQVVDDCMEEGNDIVGALIARMMMPQRFQPLDASIYERLTETLTVDELVAMVCTTAAMLGALGFRLDDIAALDPSRAAPVSTKDSESTDETFASMDDRGLDDRGPVGKSETD